jgi:hypothetical protein
MTWSRPSDRRKKANLVPSGEKTGWKSGDAPDVSRVDPAPDTLLIYMWLVASFPPANANATRAPSAENDGCLSAPSKFASGEIWNSDGFVRPVGPGVPGESEVENLNISVSAEHQVFRLDIPMDDAASMRLAQGVGDLPSPKN